MIRRAIKEWNIDKNKSFMIGDKKTDYLAAKKSKIKFYYKRGCLMKLIKKITKH